MAGLCAPLPTLRCALTDVHARLRVDVDRYSFIVSDLHRLLVAGLPAHCEKLWTLPEVVDARVPTAGRGEVRVRVLASSLNYTEVLIRRHLYPQTMRLRPPFVMGYDVVGEIDQIGDGVREFQIGDRVADMTVVGSNADYRTLSAHDVTRVPVSTLRRRPR